MEIFKTCDTKQRFSTLEKALTAVNEYYERVVLTIDPVQPYHCNSHQCFHIGHRRPDSDIAAYRKILKEIGYYGSA